MVFIYLWVTEDKYMEQLWAMEIRKCGHDKRKKKKTAGEREQKNQTGR